MCQPCECNGTGAADGQCDVNTGQCQCREGFASIKCDSCRFGHFGFLACKPCHCDVAGTQFQACDANGHCQCDEDGHCPCKVKDNHHDLAICKNLTSCFVSNFFLSFPWKLIITSFLLEKERCHEINFSTGKIKKM